MFKLSAGLLLVFAPLTASANEFSLSGFADVNAGYQFGRVRDSAAQAMFESFGLDPHPKSSQSGFGLVGTDFTLTSELSDTLVYLGEVNLQVERGQSTEFEFDVERMYFRKAFNPTVNIQAGLFFTPIGYFNRNLYSRAWMMVSAQVPDLFEEELGLVPTHTVGVQLDGGFTLPGSHRLEYAVSAGNGRAIDPVANIYARDEDPWRSATAMLEWVLPGEHKDLRFGVSGWHDIISTYRVSQMGQIRSVSDPTTEAIRMRELGAVLHAVYRGKWFSVLAEAVAQRHTVTEGVVDASDRRTTLFGVVAEASVNLGEDGRWKPYVRYDRVSLPGIDGGPYLGLRLEGDEISRFYVPDTQMVIAGAAWDPSTNQRIKLEYSLALDGVRPQHAVVVQSAFGF
jgi:hypothetical protein